MPVIQNNQSQNQHECGRDVRFGADPDFKAFFEGLHDLAVALAPGLDLGFVFADADVLAGAQMYLHRLLIIRREFFNQFRQNFGLPA